jgi:HK97 family phage major capsid protein
VKQIKSQLLSREAKIEAVRAEVNGKGESSQEVTLSLSSEAPVDQWFGREVLVHKPGAVRLGRMNNGAPLLLNHSSDQQVGAFKRGSVKIDEDGKMRGVARFSKTDRAQEIARDVEDDIRSSTSIGYRVHRMERARDLEEYDEKGNLTTPAFRVTDWEPLEGSIVSVPADGTVGVGRSECEEFTITVIDPEADVQRDAMADEGKKDMEDKDKAPVQDQPKIDINAMRTEIAEGERKRIADIDAIGAKFSIKPEIIKAAKDSGLPAGDFGRQVIDSWTPEIIRTVDPKIGMSRREIQRFSVANAGRAILLGSWKEAGFEKEISDEARKRQVAAGGMDRGPMSFTVPMDVYATFGKRDYLAQSGEGPELIETALRANEFIEMLRPSSVCIQAGARVLTGLVGNVNFPRQTSGTTFGWVTEGATTSESTGAFDTLSLTPRTVNGFTDVSRQLLLQSTPNAEAVIRSDFALGIGTALDIGALRGAGAPAPTGIAATSGIGDVDFGSVGGVPTNALMIEFIIDVANANALRGNLAYIVNPDTMGKLMTTEKATSTGLFMWDSNRPDRPVYGYPAFVTTNLRNTLTKSTGSALSEMLFGNFSELFIGTWGGLDIIVDPYTASTLGNVRFVGFQSCDVGLRHVGSFSASNEVITA